MSGPGRVGLLESSIYVGWVVYHLRRSWVTSRASVFGSLRSKVHFLTITSMTCYQKLQIHEGDEETREQARTPGRLL